MIIGGMIIVEMIIPAKIVTMAIREKKTTTMSIEGRVETVMTEITHPDKSEMIEDLIEAIDIMRTKDLMNIEEMKIIDHIIINFIAISGTIIEDLRHLKNFHIILELEMSRSGRMSDNHIMRTTNPMV